MIDYVIGVSVVVILFIIIKRSIKKAKSGDGSCSGCSSCSSSQECHKMGN
ncbi:MAG: hypothetical protein K0S01_2870 [Herbinix sp.]|jgi:hypothetical protein|nr:hypothetical protein [Herbinix sp.]